MTMTTLPPSAAGSVTQLDLILELARVTVLAEYAGETRVRDQLRDSIAWLRAARTEAGARR